MIIMLAEYFCNGQPLSSDTGGGGGKRRRDVRRAPLPTTQLLRSLAKARTRRGVVATTATAPDEVRVRIALA
jgi:hypothetical protein